jgi:hypothetical protein
MIEPGNRQDGPNDRFHHLSGPVGEAKGMHAATLPGGSRGTNPGPGRDGG